MIYYQNYITVYDIYSFVFKFTQISSGKIILLHPNNMQNFFVHITYKSNYINIIAMFLIDIVYIMSIHICINEISHQYHTSMRHATIDQTQTSRCVSS